MKLRVKRPVVFVILHIILMTLTLTAISADSTMVKRKTKQSSNSINLEELLVKAAAYTDRLEASVLYFVCREEVKEWVDPTLEARKRGARSAPVGRKYESILRAKKSYSPDPMDQERVR